MNNELGFHPGWNVWVLLGLLVASVILGLLNNLRVYEEQRVPWWGPVQKGNEISHGQSH